MKIAWFALSLVAALLPVAGFSASWQRNATVQGVAFSNVRIESGGLVIGRIESDLVVHHRPCRRGWLHLHPNGIPAAFTASEAIALPRVTIPAGTWVRQDMSGSVTVCAFPSDTRVQGHLCRGTGGPKGVQASFHPDGALRQFYPVTPVLIDGVPCAPSLLRGSVELHPNGRLKSCLLSRDHYINGVKFRKGTRLELTPDRQPVR